jgi:hypothetical protein
MKKSNLFNHNRMQEKSSSEYFSIRNRNAYLYIIFLSIALTLFSHSIFPIRDSDSFVWIPMSEDFFNNIDENVGRHRPFFGFLSYLIAILLKVIGLKDISLPIGTGDYFKVATDYEVQGDIALYFISWMILNYLFYVLSLIFAYKAAIKLTNNVKIGLLFATILAIAPEFITWLNDIPIMVPGTFIIYFSLYGIISIATEEDARVLNKKIIIYGLIYGILMLGKAQYNILIAIVTYVILFNRKLFNVTAKFTLIQFIPLICWILYLSIFGKGYAVYEVENPYGSIIDYWRGIFTRNDPLTWIDIIFTSPIYNFSIVLTFGLGIVMTIILYLTLIYYYKFELGKFILVYFYSTALFLHLVNFMMPRHTFEVAPIAYFGMAVGLVRVFHLDDAQTTNFKKLIKYFVLTIIILTLLYFNFRRSVHLLGWETLRKSPFP